MRETKFRGKVIGEFNELEALGIIDENGWVVGNLIQNGDHPMIVGDLVEIDDEYIVHDWWVSVIPESVGQYTGLKDQNVVEIYDGDIVIHNGKLSKVKWSEKYCQFRIEGSRATTGLNFYHSRHYEFIGNIHDNPELLEVEK